MHERNMRHSFMFLIVCIFCLKYCHLTRRIVMGKRTPSEKGYVVYLVEGRKYDKLFYDSWLCGGAIVSPTHILTAAACLRDVAKLYVIAGYRKYVKPADLETDPCTMERKQRVIKTCTPREYSLAYNDTSVWMNVDIGFAIVEKPYNFSDITYRLHCHYPPSAIRINFHAVYGQQNTLTDAVVFGWGHTQGMRMPGDLNNYNEEFLHEASTEVIKNDKCIPLFNGQPKLAEIINKFMLCCSGSGLLDGEGELEVGSPTVNNGCQERFRRKGFRKNCFDDYPDEYDESNVSDETLNQTTNTNPKQVSKKTNPKVVNKTEHMYNTRGFHRGTRRQGICQNDHGGPLVTWVGSDEVLIGVASTSFYDDAYLCTAPYLYTSTECTSRFIKCVLRSTAVSRRQCDEMGTELGYEIQETEILWDKTDSKTEQGKVSNSAANNNGTSSNTNAVENANWNENETQNYAKENGRSKLREIDFIRSETVTNIDFDSATDDVVLVK